MPTTSPGVTAQGTIIGTFQYMAPEQLEAKEADARTDIFAFGTVLYEMLTARKAFEGKSQASLIGAILHADPPAMATVQPLTPPALDRLVKTCLAKDPDERWQTARDLARELRWVDQETIPTVPARRRSRVRTALAVGLGVVGLAALAALAASRLRPVPPPADLMRFIVTLPDDVRSGRAGWPSADRGVPGWLMDGCHREQSALRSEHGGSS